MRIKIHIFLTDSKINKYFSEKKIGIPKILWKKYFTCKILGVPKKNSDKDLLIFESGKKIWIFRRIECMFYIFDRMKIKKTIKKRKLFSSVFMVNTDCSSVAKTEITPIIV